MFSKFKKIFFENITLKQTIIKNTLWLALAEFFSGIMRLIIVILAARTLGVTEYGKFTFALSFVSFMVIFSDFGIFNIAVREFSRNKEKEKEFPIILGLGIILDVFAIILMTAGSFFITSDQIIRKIIWLLSFFILTSGTLQLFYSFLRARQKMEYEAIIKIFQILVMSGVSLFIIFYIPSAVNLGVGYLVSNIVVLILFLLFFNFYFQPLKLKWDKNIFALLKISWPLTFGFMASWIYMTVTSIMLGYFDLINENGWYNAALKIAYATMIPVTLIISSFYPVLSNFFVNSKQSFQRNWNRLLGVMIFFAILVVSGGIAISYKIINLLYGSSFLPSVLAFEYLVIVMAVTFINYPFALLLVVSDNQKKNFFLMMFGAVINIILNFVLIPIYGLKGAVISVLASSLVNLFLTIIVSKYYTNIVFVNKNLLKIGIVSIISGILMFLIISKTFVYNLSIFISASLGFIFYTFLFFLFCKFFEIIFKDKLTI